MDATLGVRGRGPLSLLHRRRCIYSCRYDRVGTPSGRLARQDCGRRAGSLAGDPSVMIMPARRRGRRKETSPGASRICRERLPRVRGWRSPARRSWSSRPAMTDKRRISGFRMPVLAPALAWVVTISMPIRTQAQSCGGGGHRSGHGPGGLGAPTAMSTHSAHGTPVYGRTAYSPDATRGIGALADHSTQHPYLAGVAPSGLSSGARPSRATPGVGLEGAYQARFPIPHIHPPAAASSGPVGLAQMNSISAQGRVARISRGLVSNRSGVATWLRQAAPSGIDKSGQTSTQHPMSGMPQIDCVPMTNEVSFAPQDTRSAFGRWFLPGASNSFTSVAPRDRSAWLLRGQPDDVKPLMFHGPRIDGNREAGTGSTIDLPAIPKPVVLGDDRPIDGQDPHLHDSNAPRIK